jgi:FixJ family two-component response regulator
MTTEKSKIFIIDDDDSIRRSFTLLLTSAGYTVESYAGSKDFFDQEIYHGAGCILLDIFLDENSGLEIQDEIKTNYPNLPVIYITGYGDIPMSVHALKRGAINFLQKPVDEQHLLNAIEEALQESRIIIERNTSSHRINSLFQTLSPREFEVFKLVMKGKPNKQVASDLNIAEHTVKIHRGNITKKLGVKSVAEMVHLAEKAGLL